MDTALGAICVVLGAALAVVAAAVLVFGLYTLAIGHAGGWWIVELFYVLMGLGLTFAGSYSFRYGLGLLRRTKTPGVGNGPAA